MKAINYCAALGIAALGLGAALPAAASTAVGPGASSYSVEWATDGGTIADIDGSGESDFSLSVGLGTVATVSYSILDCCIVGDTYDATIDGGVVAWDTEGFTGPGGLWEGTLTTMLAAGTYIFDAIIDASGSGFILPAGGTASFDVSISAVPLPAGGLLLIGGLGGLVALRRRKKA